MEIETDEEFSIIAQQSFTLILPATRRFHALMNGPDQKVDPALWQIASSSTRPSNQENYSPDTYHWGLPIGDHDACWLFDPGSARRARIFINTEIERICWAWGQTVLRHRMVGWGFAHVQTHSTTNLDSPRGTALRMGWPSRDLRPPVCRVNLETSPTIVRTA
jgi:hypothetical protein